MMESPRLNDQKCDSEAIAKKRRRLKFTLIQRTYVPWAIVIAEVLAAGMSVRAVAESINVSHTTVLRWQKGAEPRHDDGEALINLWKQLRGDERKI